jgi:hypothetical protein
VVVGRIVAVIRRRSSPPATASLLPFSRACVVAAATAITRRGDGCIDVAVIVDRRRLSVSNVKYI